VKLVFVLFLSHYCFCTISAGPGSTNFELRNNQSGGTNTVLAQPTIQFLVFPDRLNQANPDLPIFNPETAWFICCNPEFRLLRPSQITVIYTITNYQ
jgi:hypothetical protein